MDTLEFLLVVLLVAFLVGAACLVVVDDLFTAPSVVLLVLCRVVVLEFTVPLPVLLGLVVVLLLFTVPLLVSVLLFTVPVLFLVGSVWRCVERFTLLPLFVLLLLLLSVASRCVCVDRFTVPLLREF